MINVKIELLDEKCKPIRTHEWDSGMDLKSSIDTILQPHSRLLIPTGIKTEIPIGYEAQIRPRSGLAIKRGITVLNTPGTVDSTFRGEICVILFNTTDLSLGIKQYDRIAQIVFNKIEIPTIEYGSVNETERGEGGFGSTGTK
jgi:dUTP pyrophosphatase